MHGPCQANNSASSPHSHSLPATSSVALPQAPLLYSTHARVRSRGHRPIRPCLANRLRPHRELFCFFAGGFLCPCERISPPPLLAVGRSPQPSPLHWLHLHHVTLLATKWQSAIASVRQSHLILHDPAALPTLQSAASSLASPSLPFPLRAVLLFCKLFFSLPGGAGILFIVPANAVSPSHLHPQTRIYSWPVHIRA